MGFIRWFEKHLLEPLFLISVVSAMYYILKGVGYF